jgi:iron complex outermembrane receptor protein
LTGNPAAQTIAGNTKSKGRDIINMNLRLSDFDLGGAKGEFSLWVRNLTKEDSPSNFIDFGPGFGGLTLGYFPDPRTWGATLGVRF